MFSKLFGSKEKKLSPTEKAPEIMGLYLGGSFELDALKLESDPEKRQEVRASIGDLVGTAVKRSPPPRVYVYHGDSVETVRTQP